MNDLERNKQFARDFFAAISRGDSEYVINAYTEDGGVQTMGNTLISGFFDKSQIAAAAGAIFDAFPQGIQFTIARMQARVHTARLAWHHAARLRDAGKPFKTEAAIAKITASDAAMDNARDATQIFGGNGFMNEFPVARHYRDSKILEIGEGTNEVQLLVISRALGLE